MAEVKPMASLSSGLLARKGGARPAMRPQGLVNFNGSETVGASDDLGWNDLGASTPTNAPLNAQSNAPIPINERVHLPRPAIAPVVVEQQIALNDQISVATDKPRAAPGAKGKSAFTLRLDPERHLKLRLLSAHSHRSSQRLLTEALDALLERASDTLNQPQQISPEGH